VSSFYFFIFSEQFAKPDLIEKEEEKN